jgi:D-alanyl-D-alanine carboxypeptidase/D-alanyl-D-alanine-endopeptidase (penicillin-binding protein 4)
MDTGGLYMFDGCGISRYNAVTARQLLFILEYMKKSPYFQVFYNSLPLAGVTGTLRNSFKETPAEGNLRAKTGTMSRVKSLAGYLRTETNKTIGFAIIINNYNCTTEELKEKLEHLFIHLMKL